MRSQSCHQSICAHWCSREILYLPQPSTKLSAWHMAVCATERREKAASGSFPRPVLRVLREHSATRNQLAKHQLSTVPMATMVTITIITHQNNTRHALAAPGQVLRERAENLGKDQKLKDIKIT